MRLMSALERLLVAGHTADEAKRLIGCVIATELYDVLKPGTVRSGALCGGTPPTATLPWEAQEA